MKKYEFVCKKEIKILFIYFCLCCVTSLLFFLLLKNYYTFLLLPFFLITVYIQHINILSVYKITYEGVSNCRIKIKWEEIKQCTVFFPEKKYFRGGLIEYPPMICMGCVSQGSFFQQSKLRCVTIPLTQRNLRLIKEYYKGENQEIKSMLEQYLGYPEYPDLKIHHYGDMRRL